MPETHLAGVDLNLLVALDALLAERHVTRAAARVGLTQSAMSRALARLRDLLGDELLVRAGRAMVATPRAEALTDPLRALLADAGALLRRATPFDPATSDRAFRVEGGDFIEELVLPALVPRLRAEAPGVSLVAVGVHTSANALDALERGDLDAIASVPRDTYPPTLRARHLITDGFLCLLRADHPDASALDLPRYVALDHLLVSPMGGGGGIVDALLAERGLARRVAVRVQGFLPVASIIAGSDLVTTLPATLARRVAARG
ncbi:MAG: LysR family transcriptional regulator, partial [Myxococcales bacterium]|nr:LysR family transcriptional regulator [Myxococcales bacterium]